MYCHRLYSYTFSYLVCVWSLVLLVHSRLPLSAEYCPPWLLHSYFSNPAQILFQGPKYSALKRIYNLSFLDLCRFLLSLASINSSAIPILYICITRFCYHDIFRTVVLATRLSKFAHCSVCIVSYLLFRSTA